MISSDSEAKANESRFSFIGDVRGMEGGARRLQHQGLIDMKKS